MIKNDRADINQEILKLYVHYDPQTGVFTRKVTTNGNCRRGDIAGTRSYDHIIISIEGTRYLAHRLAWLYVYGELPDKQIDHINREGDDNRIENLRLCDHSQNTMNSKLRSDNKCGVKGVYWNRRVRKWHARGSAGKKKKNLGYFDDLESAKEAYQKFAIENHGEFYCKT